MHIRLEFDTPAQAHGALALADGTLDQDGRTVTLRVPLGATPTSFERRLRLRGVRARVATIIENL